MRLIAAAAILALAGCASYSERQAQPAWHVVESTRSPADFTGCLAPRLRERWPGLSIAPDGDRTVIAQAAPSYGAVLATVTVAPAGTGSRASLRSATQTGDYRRAAGHMDACR